MTRRLVPLLLLVVAAVVAAGCGEKKDALEPSGSAELELMLDYFPNADHAGIYAAAANGDFEQVGLDVVIRQPPDPAAPLKQVAAGRADVAISYEPEVLRARDKGLDVVAIGALVREPLTSIMSLPKAKIEGPKDLKGKTVGTAGIDYQSAYLETILADAGVNPSDVKVRNVGFSLAPALLTGKVDATLGAFWNYEGTQLKRADKRPQIIKLQDVGVPTYDELVLVTSSKTLARERDRLRAFMGALSRGTRSLERDPARGIQALLKANPDLDPGLQRAVVDVTMPLFLPEAGKPFGWQDPTAWDEFAAWMKQNGLLENAPDVRGAYTNDLLPGSGL